MTVDLRWVALAIAIVTAALLVVPLTVGGGVFAIVGLGLPVLLCAIPVATAATRHAPAITWVVAVVLLAWALVLGLGFGLALLPAAVVELMAAAWQSGPRRRRA
jgi:hypothetical protein